MADEAGEIASNIGCCAAGGVVEVDGTDEGFNAFGKYGTVGDEVADFVLMSSVAEGIDGGERLFAQFLREEEGRNDDCEDDDDERYGGAEGWAFDFGAEPVVGPLG